MTIEIHYDQGDYTITADGALLGHTESYYAAALIEASYLEARNSAMMGGDPQFIEAGRFAYAGREQVEPTCICCGRASLLVQLAAFVRAVRANRPLIDIIPEAARLDAVLKEQGW